jgi:hypothetical protein
MTINDILFDANKTALDQYITILEIQLSSMPINSDVTKTIIACKDLAEDINNLYKILKNEGFNNGKGFTGN